MYGVVLSMKFKSLRLAGSENIGVCILSVDESNRFFPCPQIAGRQQVNRRDALLWSSN